MIDYSKLEMDLSELRKKLLFVTCHVTAVRDQHYHLPRSLLDIISIAGIMLDPKIEQLYKRMTPSYQKYQRESSGG